MFTIKPFHLKLQLFSVSNLLPVVRNRKEMQIFVALVDSYQTLNMVLFVILLNLVKKRELFTLFTYCVVDSEMFII